MLADINLVNTNDCRKLGVSCCCVAYCDLGCRMFWAPRAGGYKWQYILIAAFSSFSGKVRVTYELRNSLSAFAVLGPE